MSKRSNFPEESVYFRSVRGLKRFHWSNPSVSNKVRETVCLEESESIGLVEAERLADLEHGEVVRNGLSG